MKPIRILLVDDHRLVRSGIRLLIHSLPGMTVVAEASDGGEALAITHQDPPDVVLLDISMEGMSGLEALPIFSRDFPDVRVIILSCSSREDDVIRALQSGAAAYLVKDSLTVELELAIRAVADGKTFLSPGISDSVIRRAIIPSESKEYPSNALTSRQREVLQLIAEGKSTKEIASVLGIALKTTEAHRQQLMERLNIHHVPGLVRYAIRVGIISA